AVLSKEDLCTTRSAPYGRTMTYDPLVPRQTCDESAILSTRGLETVNRRQWKCFPELDGRLTLVCADIKDNTDLFARLFDVGDVLAPMCEDTVEPKAKQAEKFVQPATQKGVHATFVPCPARVCSLPTGAAVPPDPTLFAPSIDKQGREKTVAFFGSTLSSAK